MAGDSVGASAGRPAPNVPELPLKASDHALDALHFALHSMLPAFARAEAMVAELGARGPHPRPPLLRGEGE